MDFNEFKDEFKNIKFKVNPKINWDKFKTPTKMIDFEETTFDIKFNKDIKDKDIQLKIEIDGNASIFTSGVNDENFHFQPTLLGEFSIKDETEAGDINFDYQIKPEIKMNGKIEKTNLHLGINKDLTGNDVILSLNVNGEIETYKSIKGEATLKMTIKS